MKNIVKDMLIDLTTWQNKMIIFIIFILSFLNILEVLEFGTLFWITLTACLLPLAISQTLPPKKNMGSDRCMSALMLVATIIALIPFVWIYWDIYQMFSLIKESDPQIQRLTATFQYIPLQIYNEVFFQMNLQDMAWMLFSFLFMVLFLYSKNKKACYTAIAVCTMVYLLYPLYVCKLGINIERGSVISTYHSPEFELLEYETAPDYKFIKYGNTEIRSITKGLRKAELTHKISALINKKTFLKKQLKNLSVGEEILIISLGFEIGWLDIYPEILVLTNR